MRIHIAAALGFALLASACSHAAPVDVSPNLNVYSSYGDKLPGNYLLYVGSQDLAATVKPTGAACSFHSFPLDITETFRVSALKTMEQLVESVEMVSTPVPAAELARTGKTGMIVIQPQSMTTRIQFIEGFWSMSGEASSEIAASLTVDSAGGGRVLGTTASGDARASGSAGSICQGGATIIGEATEKSLEELFGQIGERFTNSPRLRAAPAASAQP